MFIIYHNHKIRVNLSWDKIALIPFHIVLIVKAKAICQFVHVVQDNNIYNNTP